MSLTHQQWSSRFLNISVALAFSNKVNTSFRRVEPTVQPVVETGSQRECRILVSDLNLRLEREIFRSIVGDMRLSDITYQSEDSNQCAASLAFLKTGKARHIGDPSQSCLSPEDIINSFPTTPNHLSIVPQLTGSYTSSDSSSALPLPNLPTPSTGFDSNDSRPQSTESSEEHVTPLSPATSSNLRNRRTPPLSRNKGLSKLEENLLSRLKVCEYTLATMSPYDFNNHCQKLTQNEIIVLRDIRRRSKNKIAARECRKRRMNIQTELTTSVDALEKHHRDLKLRLESLKTVKQHLLSLMR